MIVHLPHALSSESLDDLADLAATLFSPIPNRGCEPLPMINDHPFGPEEKGVHFTNDLDIYNSADLYLSFRLSSQYKQSWLSMLWKYHSHWNTKLPFGNINLLTSFPISSVTKDLGRYIPILRTSIGSLH